MKKILFGVITLIIVFNFVARVPLTHADATQNVQAIDPAQKAILNEELNSLTAVLLEMQQVAAKEGQLNPIDPKDAATLASALNALQGLLTEIKQSLAAGTLPWDKTLVSATLDVIKTNLTFINGTLAALQEGAAVVQNPAPLPPAIASQPEKSIPAASQNETPTTAMNENPEGTPLSISAEPTAENGAAPETAQASAGFDYHKLTWPIVILVVGAAIITLSFWRKDEKEPAVSAATSSGATHLIDEPEPSFEPVELPAESLFPTQTPPPAVYSPLRSVVTPAGSATTSPVPSADAPVTPAYKPVFLTEKSAATQRPAVHPPAVHQHPQKEHDGKKNQNPNATLNRKPA